MRRSSIVNSIMAVLVVALMCGYASAAELTLDTSRVLAVVPVKSGNVDQSVYRQVDRVVPDLKKLAVNKIVKLECRYSGRPDRALDVENAYKMAARIEKYLRVRHKLNLDLWVSIDITPASSHATPVLTIAVFSDDMKKLDAVPVDPAGSAGSTDPTAETAKN